MLKNSNPLTSSSVIRLMTKMFELLASGSIRPIEPRTVFPYRDIAGAIRYMRGGEHIGKIIISREAPDNDPNVPVSTPNPIIFPLLSITGGH